MAPDGSLHARRVRGTLTGNRGVIHDPDTKSLLGRRWTTKAWIACTCEWKGHRRDVWGRNGPHGRAGWTELFFLDEPTALAAGHRPCFHCRREAALRFAAAFRAGNGLEHCGAPEIDRILHGERRLSGRAAPPVLRPEQVFGLPDGTIIQSGPEFLALRHGRLLAWSFSGYGRPMEIGEIGATPLGLVTPACVVGALAAGYRPRWHGEGAHGAP